MTPLRMLDPVGGLQSKQVHLFGLGMLGSSQVDMLVESDRRDIPVPRTKHRFGERIETAEITLIHNSTRTFPLNSVFWAVTSQF